VADAFLERWLEDVVATPGLTGIRDLALAREMLLDDALRGLPLLDTTEGDVLDVGSGGGSPGIPLAVARPARGFTLLDAERRKCSFLERTVAALPNVRVVWGRAEEQEPEAYVAALAKALAKPPTAVELCLPLVAVGGLVVLWVGPTTDREHVARVADRLGGELEPQSVQGLVAVRKVRATPAGFPRRPGVAKKRPLG
jgi:16S rRNA (guanine527-N7)-methyltransferase